jgi:glycosyltransferase involved in cell wall biosynthesis
VRAAGRDLARIARATGADLVQLNAPALAAEGGFPCPVLAVAHSCVGTWWQAVRAGPIDSDLAWRAALTEEGLAAADAVVAPSAAFAAALAQRYRLAAPPAVVPNGRRPIGFRDDPPLDFAFTAGRLWDAAKNMAVLDRAAAGLRIRLRAAGPLEGPNGTALPLFHAEALGPLSDSAVAAHLSLRPVFASAALYEPFGLAVLEAAQAGCALVLSDIPTFRELWDGAARFVYPHDADGYARAIDEIVADPALRARLGDAARTRARRYTARRMGEEMLQLYAGLVAAPALEAAE